MTRNNPVTTVLNTFMGQLGDGAGRDLVKRTGEYICINSVQSELPRPNFAKFRGIRPRVYIEDLL